METDDGLVRWGEGYGPPEPVVSEDRAGYREVRSSTSIAIAGGECEFTGVDIAQPDICVSGGFSEWMKIQALASSFGVTVIPHVWGSGIALAAALHVLASIPARQVRIRHIPFRCKMNRSSSTIETLILSEMNF
ncbi:enolase C-terminal domain-like protein [Paenibacillus naphthalenovorans]|uniref:enolase C-terminal domain-like protein n=1 Tax=Paenibacillus naphthalenovorans TaxID=162209 RepID=UPI003D274988